MRNTKFKTAHEYELLALKRMTADAISKWLDEQEKDEYYYRLGINEDDE